MATVVAFGGTTEYLTGAMEWSERLEDRVNAASIPRRHGAKIDSDPKLGARIVDVSGVITATNATNLRTSLDTLKNRIFNGRQKLYLIDDRYLWAVCESFDYTFVSGFAARAVKYSVTFFADDPFYYAASVQTKVETAIVSGTEIAISCDLTTVATHGNADPPAIFTFDVDSGTATSFRAYNTNTNINRWLQVDYSMTTAIVLEVDCGNHTVTYNTMNILPYFTGSFFDLRAGETNSITVLSTGANADLTISWLPRWY
jgi:hypothetical protein